MISPTSLEILDAFEAGEALSISSASALIEETSSGTNERINHLADVERKAAVGDEVTYIVNANVNFTNVCYTDCKYCGFYRRPNDPDAYTHDDDVLREKFARARDFGVTEICMQGGLNPAISLDRYEEVLRLAQEEIPGVHMHAYSPAEIDHIQRKTRLPLEVILKRLKEAGLGSIPGTAAEILVERVKSMISPRRIPVERWCEIIRAAHSVGIPTTSTIMYGHIESAADVAEHMGILRSIQAETDDEEKGRFTEFVPLPFIPYDNTMGPEFGINKVADLDYIFRIHAVARLFLKDSIKNIQVAWPKIGIGAAKQALSLGVNDMGGTLLEENITRESGGEYGQALTVGQFREAIATAGRTPVQRSTTYERIPEDDPRYRPPRPGDDEMLGEKSTGGEKLISL
ncbi:MAG: 5-amino-6-(D-ribitylamino)uracil--L-tyrosine 4-hydroxyphenyl transferase CofH [Nitrospinaceae bacterium]|jgi:FO synthase|nr:5-amino-6-(D-ribitylamino)uracil--L-tyrosine 4-hydroxyphenyl transferase CofH [Nitrospinaceae bacterium]MBT3435490.1 5-amino-6-(D-ribitylamino)uracil--L-tyrosine 4-hydroxyphenyl transferase CofH [Nitrospinaceae bacterium]MBT3822860.1 5-amino-6-(D-ribitylamino)uracil--L-tyrosine 4-hydroxyphenyl transferase CofH [Nitrospinaceae bacterium]MBT4094590.1 5-amino-6-(D-ribitylamino)uracil--L-tyrosine 4-hydroxyphenyl transferase CofH [Nitrospinaceae bacterium]MBT4430551.1 5-amino-6-(D-ribitylamino)ur